MRGPVVLISLVTLGFAFQANAQSTPPATPDFLRAAAQTDEYERQEGRLAETRAADARVRGFGVMMVRDHTRTTAALKAAVRRAHLAMPASSPVSGDQEQKIAALRALHGRDFDRQYVSQQVAAHQDALGVMQAYARSGDNPTIRRAAAGTVPIVEHHLSAARALEGLH